MMTTKVTNIEIVPVKPVGGLLAFVTAVLDDKWYVGNIAVYTRLRGGYRLVYPTKKVGNNNFPIFHPINKQIGEDVEKAIIKKLETLWQTQETTNQNPEDQTTMSEPLVSSE